MRIEGLVDLLTVSKFKFVNEHCVHVCNLKQTVVISVCF